MRAVSTRMGVSKKKGHAGRPIWMNASGFGGSLLHAVLTAKLVHAAGGVQDLLLARVEGVA